MFGKAGLPTHIAIFMVAVGLLGACLRLGFSHFNTASQESFGKNQILPALIGGLERPRERFNPDRRFHFPEDHGAHSRSLLESWRFVGRLKSGQQRSYAFQLVVFRIGLSQDSDSNKSAWRSRQLYRGHLTLTDIENDQFYSYERFSRDALDLSGAETDPIRVWLEDWVFEYQTSSNGMPIFKIEAAYSDVNLDLELPVVNPIVDPGNEGLFGNGRGPYHAYLAVGLKGRGEIGVAAERIPVDGSATLEHAWGGIPLPGGQIAWDRFLFLLDDGRTLNCLRLRRRGGGGNPISTCLLVHADGSVSKLGRQDVAIDELKTWTSPLDGLRYPSRWQFQAQGQALRFELEPSIANQEINESMRYWSGAVSLQGESRGETINGHGFVDLLGYELPRDGKRD